jgi:hypothetical protein
MSRQGSEWLDLGSGRALRRFVTITGWLGREIADRLRHSVRRSIPTDSNRPHLGDSRTGTLSDRAGLQEVGVSVRLKIEDSSEGLVATISQRDDTGKVIGTPSALLVGSKEAAKQQAKTLARSLGLKVYGIVDKTGAGEQPSPWLVPGVGKSL